MVAKLVLLGVHAIEVMFFTGLLGCALVVVISWISIFKSDFADGNSED
jgi:hypothetical protein